MVILLPVGILLLATLAIIILRQYKTNIGYAWFIAVGSSLAAWGLILASHWIPTLPYVMPGYGLLGYEDTLLAFQIDLVSFPYALSIVTIGFVVILTDLARIKGNIDNSWLWAATLAISGAGLLSIMAVTPMTIIISWTIIDLIELFFIARDLKENGLIRENILAFAARIAGTMMVVVAAFYSRSLGQALNIDNVLPSASIFLLVASGLRLGVIPLHIPYREIGLRRGLGTVIRLVGPASSLVILSRLPAPGIIAEWASILQFLLTITILYSSLMWLTSENEITGRPYWVVTISAYAIGCAVRSQPAASIGWGLVLLLSGCVIFLFSARKLQLFFIPVLGLIGLSGLPFTPASSSWQGLINPSFDLFSLGFIISQLILIWGYLRFSLQKGDSYDKLERWAQILYPIGLMFLVLVEWFIGIFGWPGSFTSGSWGLSISIALVSVLVFMGYFQFRSKITPILENPQFVKITNRVVSIVASFLSLNWLLSMISFLYGIVQRLVESLTLILEGEGGMLWALLLLVLMLSVLYSGIGF